MQAELPVLQSCRHEAAARKPSLVACATLALSCLSDPVLAEHLRRCTGASTRRWLGWQSQVKEDLANHDLIDDEADDSTLAIAFRAVQYILEKDALDQRPVT